MRNTGRLVRLTLSLLTAGRWVTALLWGTCDCVIEQS